MKSGTVIAFAVFCAIAVALAMWGVSCSEWYFKNGGMPHK